MMNDAMTYKPKIGDIVFLEAIGYKKRYLTGLIETKIQWVGRKYFTVEHKDVLNRDGAKFRLSDFSHVQGDYSPEFEFYRSVGEYETKIEREEQLKYFRDMFCEGYGQARRQKLTVDQLRKMRAIIEEPAQTGEHKNGKHS
jgi:hypothetical protein